MTQRDDQMFKDFPPYTTLNINNFIYDTYDSCKIFTSHHRTLKTIFLRNGLSSRHFSYDLSTIIGNDKVVICKHFE